MKVAIFVGVVKNMRLVTGMIAVAIALISVLLSFVPGAASLMGLALSLFALVFSLLSVSAGGDRLFKATGVLCVGGVLLVNDALRLWHSADMPPGWKIVLYGLVAATVAGCFYAARKLRSRTAVE